MTRLAIALAILLTVPVWMPTPEAHARRGGGFSRSFGSRSFGRRSFGRRSSSRSGRKGGLFGSRRSSRGRGFTRSRRPSYNKRGQRMLSRTKASTASRSSRATRYRDRHSRPRTVINNRYYGGGWGSLGWGMRSVGIWDLFFLSTVNQLFWYHHWKDPAIHRALYEENLLQKDELEKLEARVDELEAEGVERDPNYLPDDVDPDLAYSKEYVEKNPDEFYADETEEDGIGFWTLLVLAGVGVAMYLSFVRRY